PTEKLHDIQPGAVGPDAPQAQQLPHLVHTGIFGGANAPGTLLGQILDLSVHELPALVLAQQPFAGVQAVPAARPRSATRSAVPAIDRQCPAASSHSRPTGP